MVSAHDIFAAWSLIDGEAIVGLSTKMNTLSEGLDYLARSLGVSDKSKPLLALSS